MKKIIFLLFVVVLFYSITVLAVSNSTSVEVDNITAQQGETVTVPIRISNNSGITGAVLTVSYDDNLTLTNVTKGDALGSLNMTKPGDLTVNTFNLLWDGMDPDSTDGIIVNLTFEAPNAAGSYPISVAHKSNSVVDGNLEPVVLNIQNGGITIEGSGETTLSTITIDKVNASQGETITVPVRISENPGIAGAVLTFSYSSDLVLTEVTQGDALSSLSMTKPGNLTSNPFNLLWDGTEADISNGIIANLTFQAPSVAGTYSISATYKQNSIVDGNIEPVNISILNGSITVDGSTGTIPTISIDTVDVTIGEIITVPVRISDNPGIAGATLTFSYDSDLVLTDVTQGDALSSLNMTKPGDLTANPFNVLWDGTESNVSNGIIINLIFQAKDVTGTYQISASYGEGSVVNGDVEPVTLEIENGGVTVKDGMFGDLNGDNVIDSKDLMIIIDADNYNKSIHESGVLPECDLNKDDLVNFADLALARNSNHFQI